MIGHFVNNLTPFEEDRVLGGKLGPFNCAYSCREVPSHVPGCIQQVVGDAAYDRQVIHTLIANERVGLDEAQCHHMIGFRYDNLVRKFGVPRIANAIRNRIFSNQVRRKLAQPQPEYASAAVS